MFASAKGKQQKKVRQLQCQELVRNSVLIISHTTFRYCRVHIFPTTFLEIAVYFWLGKDVAGSGEGEEFFTQSQSVEMHNLCSAKGRGS